MYPVIFKFGFITIYSYGLMLVLGFLLSLFLARRALLRQGIEPYVLSNLYFLLLILGVIGARLLYVILHFSLFRNRLFDIFLLNRGGLSWFGGLFLAFIGGIYYLRKKRLRVIETLDFLAPYVALAQAVGRIGCLLNGCCFGYPSEFGLYFPVHNARLIPTQLYSSIILLLIFLSLRFFQERRHKAGSILSLYFLLYSTKRFFIEFFRAEERIFFLGLSIFQWISAAVFVLSLAALIVIRFKVTSRK